MMTIQSNYLATRVAAVLLFGYALSASAEKVTQPINVFDLFREGKVEYHLGPQEDLNDAPTEIFKMQGDLFHITGRGYGHMATKQDFDNYHLVLEFKWGPNTWGDRKTHARDNGILYHATGPLGALMGSWPASFEANVIQGGMGDLLVLSCKAPDGTPLEYSAVCEYVLDRDQEKCWKRGQPRRKVTSGRINWEKRDVDWTDTLDFRGKDDIDAPVGEWNRLEVIARGNTTVHIFNGQVVNEAFELSPWSGKICIQTEGAEMFVRRYELLPLDSFCEPWPPEYAGPPLPRHAVTNRAFTGISSLAVASNGRLWVTWYAGHTPGEDHNNYVVLATSADNGQSWREVLVVDPDAEGPRRTYDPEVWIAPDNKLRWIWSDRSNPKDNVRNDTVWMTVLDDPTSESTAWHPPVYVTPGVMMCKPIVLSTGEWALPVCTWFSADSSKMVVSTDDGKTWTVRGGANMVEEDRLFDEHMFVERKDGSLWCLSRAKSGIREAVSTDQGKTWSPLEPSLIQHPSARFFITRLVSGNLLLVKHGLIDQKIGRSHLMAFVSKDDGKSWEGGLLLDERNGVSYPDGQQRADGTIYITYDFDRTGARNILFTTFREEDVLAGKPVSTAVRLRQLVSQGSGGAEKLKPQVNANVDGVLFEGVPAGLIVADNAEQAAFELGATLFSDRSYICAELPAALKGMHFLRIPMDGEKTLRCTRAGNVYVLTPVVGRNKDSVAELLLQQGFKKVALPEVRLFSPGSPANFCTLYQKGCVDNETVTFDKWAVPLFFNE